MDLLLRHVLAVVAKPQVVGSNRPHRPLAFLPWLV